MKSPHCPDANLATADRDGVEAGCAAGRRGMRLDQDHLEIDIGLATSAPDLAVLRAQRNASAADMLSDTGCTPHRHPRIPRHRTSILDTFLGS